MIHLVRTGESEKVRAAAIKRAETLLKKAAGDRDDAVRAIQSDCDFEAEAIIDAIDFLFRTEPRERWGHVKYECTIFSRDLAAACLGEEDPPELIDPDDPVEMIYEWRTAADKRSAENAFLCMGTDCTATFDRTNLDDPAGYVVVQTNKDEGLAVAPVCAACFQPEGREERIRRFLERRFTQRVPEDHYVVSEGSLSVFTER